MEPVLTCLKQIHSPLYDRRLMILILKKYNGRRSFSESCKLSKIKDERRYRQYESAKKITKTEATTTTETYTETQEQFRVDSPVSPTE